jgi:SPP1 family predicted phage head-tail adaptor
MALRRRGDGQTVRAGDMSRQVRIKKYTQSSDGQGGRTGTASTVATVWANIIPVAANRVQAYGLTMTNKPYEIDMRYNDTDFTVDEDDVLEVVETGQVLYVHSAINADVRNERYKVLAIEKK